MPYELFIALRYLRAKRRQAAVSILTAIAVAGITTGVAALIVAQALFTGFREEVQEKILGGTAHLNLLKNDNSGIVDYRALAERVSPVPGVRAAAATSYEQVLLNVADRQELAILKGVDFQAPREANDIFATTIEGSPDEIQPREPSSSSESTPHNEAPALDGMIVGKELARALAVHRGDVVTVLSSHTRLTPLGLQPRYTRFRVAGIFSSGLYEYDSKWAYISLAAAQRLAGEGDTAGLIQMKVADIYAVNEIAARVRAVAGPEFITTTWQDLNRPLFSALQLQQKVVVIFFALLIVMAALNIITTLTMMVIEKQRDIAILRAQGATSRGIMRIFILQGTVIGLAGAMLGVALGVGLSHLANVYHLVALPAEFYSVSQVTLKVRTLDCFAIATLAIIISFLATIYPARSAARVVPVEALRYE